MVRYTVQRIHALGQVRRAQPGTPANLAALLSASLLCLCVQELRPKGQDVRIEELGSMVDNEMIATSTAIEEAVLRMDVRTRSSPSTAGRSDSPLTGLLLVFQEILTKAKKDTSGIHLEVNQR